jgi:tetratricopeptide (TPR) repeat protein
MVLGMIFLSLPAMASEDDRDLCNSTGDRSPINQRVQHCTVAIQMARRGGEYRDTINLIDALVSRCHAYRYQSQFELARKDCADALQALARLEQESGLSSGQDREHYAYAARGALFSSMGQNKRALDDENTAIDAIDDPEPGYAYIFTNRAIDYGKLSDFDNALADLDQAIRLNADYMPAYVRRGLEYERRGDFARAKADFSRAVALPAGIYDFGHEDQALASKHLSALASK